MKNHRRMAIVFAATLLAILSISVFSRTLWEPLRTAVEKYAPEGLLGSIINLMLPILVWLTIAAVFAAVAFWANSQFKEDQS